MIDLLDVILFDDLGNKENRDVFKSSILEYDLHLKFIIPSSKTQFLNFSRIDIPLYRYRKHEKNMTNDKIKMKFQNQRIKKKHKKYVK